MIASVLLWCGVTAVLYMLCLRLSRACGDFPLLHPVVTCSAAVIALLVAFHVPYAQYQRSTSGISFLLLPATIALAVPLYRELAAIRSNAAAVFASLLAGSATVVISGVWLARLFGCDSEIVRSLAPKAVTTPVAMAVSAQIGGSPSLSAVFAILSGIVGAMAAPFVLRRWKPRIAGIAIGTSAHGIGTAKLLSRNLIAGAFSGLAMGLNAILTALVLPFLARFFIPLLAIALLTTTISRAQPAPIVLVPLDDRPVTLQLPVMLGEIAGRRVATPPADMLGRYLEFGKPDAISVWLNAEAPRDARAFVLSSDMLAYGGLVGSRVPGTTYADAYFRLHELSMLRAARPKAWIGVFGTIMRLAPTGVPSIGDAAKFFAAYPAWSYLQRYANLHDPFLPEEEATAEHLRDLMGEPTLDAYLQTRARNYGVDRLLLDLARANVVDRLVLGQDDAGPVGLHVREVRSLESFLDGIGNDRASIEPGADELGMALVANALARDARWTPRVAVRYSTPTGASYQDPLEFAPISTTIQSLIGLCGGIEDEADPDIVLAVHVPRTGELDDAFLASIASDLQARRPVAVADLSYEQSYAVQGAFAQRLLSSGIASQLDAYAAWNTDANTVGTALAEAIAAGAGRRTNGYDRLAHQTFTFMRFVDDVDFHVNVRPDLNRWLDAQGVTDHTYLLPGVASATAERNRSLLWSQAQMTLGQLYPGLHIAAMQITLPWNRTFETGLDVRLAPNL